MATRQEVFSVVSDERVFQDRKWGTIQEHPHEVGSWLTIMRQLLGKAEAAYMSQSGDRGALDELRKVAAVSVACLEQHGPVARKPIDFAAQSNNFTVHKAEVAVQTKPSAASQKEQWLADNLNEGEAYAGLVLATKEGEQDYHLVLLPGRDNKRYTWSNAMEAAKAAGGDLPTRRELRVLWVNLKQHFEDAWYWSNEQDAADSDFAWIQGFSDGYQDRYHKSNECRARAVRRVLVIQ